MGSINIDETFPQGFDFPISDLNTTNTLDFTNNLMEDTSFQGLLNGQQLVIRQIRDNIRKIHFDKIIDRQ